MSAETDDLIKLVVVTDHDCGNYRIGEVDVRYNTDELREHIKRYGGDELLLMLGYLTHKVFEMRTDLVLQQAAEQAVAETAP